MDMVTVDATGLRCKSGDRRYGVTDHASTKSPRNPPFLRIAHAVDRGCSASSSDDVWTEGSN